MAHLSGVRDDAGGAYVFARLAAAWLIMASAPARTRRRSPIRTVLSNARTVLSNLGFCREFRGLSLSGYLFGWVFSAARLRAVSDGGGGAGQFEIQYAPLHLNPNNKNIIIIIIIVIIISWISASWPTSRACATMPAAPTSSRVSRRPGPSWHRRRRGPGGGLPGRLSPAQRDQAKPVCYGLLYGMAQWARPG